MDTIIEQITGNESEDALIYEKAGSILKDGGLVAFPTATVYGLGGDALNKDASRKIYAAKGRPSDNPLIVHIADRNDLYKLAEEVPETALKLADAFMPGPITIILKKKECVPGETTGGLDTVAIRMPRHPVAARMIRESGVYVAAPSANTSGRPSPTKAKYVIEDLNGKVDMIIADDTVDIGIESTIVDLSEEVPTVLRPGYITLEMLRKVLGRVEIDKAVEAGNILASDIAPKAPGMKYRHYAPKAELTIVSGNEDSVAQKINELVSKRLEDGAKVGIMTTDENIYRYTKGEVRSLGLRADEATVAKNLFAVLREFDDIGAEYIYSEAFANSNVGQAVMNRLIKAAGHSIIEV